MSETNQPDVSAGKDASDVLENALTRTGVEEQKTASANKGAAMRR